MAVVSVSEQRAHQRLGESFHRLGHSAEESAPTGSVFYEVPVGLLVQRWGYFVQLIAVFQVSVQFSVDPSSPRELDQEENGEDPDEDAQNVDFVFLIRSGASIDTAHFEEVGTIVEVSNVRYLRLGLYFFVTDEI